jgi:DNA replication protein DnaC
MPQSEVTSVLCPECGGSGWVLVPDGGAGRARACSCRRQQINSSLIEAAGIPERYAHCKVSSFVTASPDPGERDQLLQARSAAQLYVDQFLKEGGGYRDSGLLFVGPSGTGKTHLAVGILKELITRYGVRGRFVDFNSLLYQIQATFDPGSPESKRQILDPLTESDVVVLDELGAQQPTPWVRDTLYLIINQRYMRRRPTLFTSNYYLGPPTAELGPGRPRPKPENLDRGRDAEPAAPPADTMRLLSSRIPAPLVSRLYEMAQPIELTRVEDFRREHQRKARVAP